MHCARSNAAALSARHASNHQEQHMKAFLKEAGKTFGIAAISGFGLMTGAAAAVGIAQLATYAAKTIFTL